MKKLTLLFTLLLFITLSAQGFCDRKYTFAEDLNSDGEKESISVIFTGKNARDVHDYIININNTEYKGSFPYDGIVSAQIVDIDKSDGQKELLARFDGETDDVLDHFFVYDGSIKKIGELPGADRSLISGNGIVTIPQWMGFWGRETEYRLEGSVLKIVEEEYALDIKSEIEKDMVLWSGYNNTSRISATLKAGAKINITKVMVVNEKCTTDDGYEHNCEWYYVESADGTSGWVEYGELIKSTMNLPWAG